MTAVPRVRVELAGSGRANGRYCYLYAVRCEIHGWISNAQTWSPALPSQAADHARTCPALRLVRLVAELEKLRDSRVNMQPTDLVTWGIKSEDHCRGWAAAQRQAAADLTALLGRLG